MLTISEFYGIKIYIFYDDHKEPHLHAYYGEFEGEISINTGKLIKGELTPRAMKLVKEWMEEHKEELRENWKLAEEHKKLKKVDPLK